MSRQQQQADRQGDRIGDLTSLIVDRMFNRLRAEFEVNALLGGSETAIEDLCSIWAGGNQPTLPSVVAGMRLYEAGHDVSAGEIARCLCELGDLDEAIEWYARCSDSGPHREETAIAVDVLRTGPGLCSEGAESPIDPLARVMLVVLDDSASRSDMVRTSALVRGFRANGWSVSCALSCTGQERQLDVRGVAEALEGFSLDVLEIADGASDWLGRLHGLSAQLESSIRSVRPAVVHVAASVEIALAAQAAGRRTGVPVVLEVRSLATSAAVDRPAQWEGSQQHQLQRALEQHACRGAAAIVAASGQLRNALIERGVGQDDVHVLVQGVDPLRFSVSARDMSRDVPNEQEHPVVVGFIGSLTASEGLSLLVAAFARLNAASPGAARLLIVGDGPARAELEQQAQDLGIGACAEFRDRVDPAEVSSHYGEMDICVFPRPSDGHGLNGTPLKPLEAMAHAKAVLGSDAPAMAELLDPERTAIRFEHDDCDSLVEQLQRLVSDGGLRARLGRTAREWVECHRDWLALTRIADSVHGTAKAPHPTNASWIAPSSDPLVVRVSRIVDEMIGHIRSSGAGSGSSPSSAATGSSATTLDAMAGTITQLQGEVAALRKSLVHVQQAHGSALEALGHEERDRALAEDALRTVQQDREAIHQDMTRMSATSGMALTGMFNAARGSVRGRVLLPLRVLRFMVDAGYRTRWKRRRLQRAGLKAEVEQTYAQMGPRVAANLLWHRWSAGKLPTTEVLRHVFALFKDGWRQHEDEDLGREVTEVGLAHGRLLLGVKWSEDLRHQLQWRYRKIGMPELADQCAAMESGSLGEELQEAQIAQLRDAVQALPGEAETVPSGDEEHTPTHAEILQRCLEDSVEACEAWVRGWSGPGRSSKVDRLMWESLKDAHKEGVHAEWLLRDAVRYGRRIGIAPKYLQWRCHRVGDIVDSVAIRRKIPLADRKGNVRWDDHEAKVRLLTSGRTFPAIAPSRPETSATTLYVLHNTLPLSSSGYATRTHGLLKSIRSTGIDAHGVTRPGYPWDRFPDDAQPEDVAMTDVIDGIAYHRTDDPNMRYGKVPIDQYLDLFERVMDDVIVQHDPCLIHAASNFMNGIAGGSAARKAGIPWIYEVRGLWEVTRASRQPSWHGSHEFQFIAGMERDAARHADVVITLTTGLRDEMIQRGVDGDRIVLVPNGVDVSRFTPCGPDEFLREELGIGDRTIIGYIGSTVPYEGLDDLLDAVSVLRETHGDSFRLLVVGDGQSLPELKEKAERLELGRHVIFTGRVPHEDVERYYSLIDINPFPRKPQPVCEMVSPLKPFEAMALQKAVVASDVQALRDIVQDGVTGLLFEKGSTTSLVRCLDRLMNDPALRDDLGAAARRWVIEERDWSVLGGRVAEVYRSLMPSGVLSRRHQPQIH